MKGFEYTLKVYTFDCTHTLAYAYKNKKVYLVLYIIRNIFCVLQKKLSQVWNDIRGSKLWGN